MIDNTNKHPIIINLFWAIIVKAAQKHEIINVSNKEPI